MPNTSPAEALLALFAGPQRATAVMGDLTEMAQTRGRLWLVAAYARTLFSFTWRIVLALFVADYGRNAIFNLFHIYMQHTPAIWRSATGSRLDLLNSMGPLLATVTSTLWFALPFAAILYGVRDRFVQLTFAIAVGTTLAFLCIPWASLLVAVATLALATAALFSSTWRRPLEVLLWTGAAGLLAVTYRAALRAQLPRVFPHSSGVLARSAIELAFAAAFWVIAFVCARMHKLLLDPPAAGSVTSA